MLEVLSKHFINRNPAIALAHRVSPQNKKPGKYLDTPRMKQRVFGSTQSGKGVPK
jgi:hypothetical protein